MQVHTVERDISVLADVDEVPGIGYLPINAFVLRAAEPVVVDTGLSRPSSSSWRRSAPSSTPPMCAGSG